MSLAALVRALCRSCWSGSLPTWSASWAWRAVWSCPAVAQGLLGLRAGAGRRSKLDFGPALGTSWRAASRQFLRVAGLLLISWLPLIVFTIYSVFEVNQYIIQAIGPMTPAKLDNPFATLMEMMRVFTKPEHLQFFAKLELGQQLVLLLNLPLPWRPSRTPMKPFSGRTPPKLVDRSTAWACLLTNLASPGLGSLAAGPQGRLRATHGGADRLHAEPGLDGWFLLDWWREGELPLGFRPSLWVGLAGVALFATGWTWALETSLDLLRAARKPPRPPHDGTPRSSAD